MSQFDEGLYAISPFKDDTSPPRYAVSDGVSKPVKVERLVGSFKAHMVRSIEGQLGNMF